MSRTSVLKAIFSTPEPPNYSNLNKTKQTQLSGMFSTIRGSGIKQFEKHACQKLSRLVSSNLEGEIWNQYIEDDEMARLVFSNQLKDSLPRESTN